MTCIIGIAERSKVWIGADSCSSNGNRYALTPDTGKLFRFGQMLIAVAGNFRCGQLIRYTFQPAPFEQGQNPTEYLINEFANPLRELFKEHGVVTESQDQPELGDASCFHALIGLDGRLFRCDGNFQIIEHSDGFDAHGCGGDLARGALCVLPSDLTPKERILRALEAAARFDVKVGPPFVVESI